MPTFKNVNKINSKMNYNSYDISKKGVCLPSGNDLFIDNCNKNKK